MKACSFLAGESEGPSVVSVPPVPASDGDCSILGAASSSPEKASGASAWGAAAGAGEAASSGVPISGSSISRSSTSSYAAFSGASSAAANEEEPDVFSKAASFSPLFRPNW